MMLFLFLFVSYIVLGVITAFVLAYMGEFSDGDIVGEIIAVVAIWPILALMVPIENLNKKANKRKNKR